MVSHATSDPSQPCVTVVIPTFNRAEMLARVLLSYLQSPLVLEVLIVDDGSTDSVRRAVSELCQLDNRIRLLCHPSNQGMTFARNTGISHARGNLVLFSEDDLALGPQFIEVLVSHMEGSGADIIAGRRIWMRPGEDETGALRRANRQLRPVINRRLLEHHSHAVTDTDVQAPLVDATMLVRRDVLEKVRFADCYPGNSWREESDFQLSAQESGFKVVFCPHALSYHHARSHAGRGRNRLVSDITYLQWIFRNNLTFLRRHRSYLQTTLPEALVWGSPLLTTLAYIVHRSLWLAQAEFRRMWTANRGRTV